MAAEETGERVLLVSTDPAPSLADALDESDSEWARHDVERELESVRGLVVRQMDASAAFARIRDEYQNRIDTLFESLIGRGVDVSQDREILRDLLALAPPGIDELFALALLGDTLAERRFARVIVDPAPTGHLLRLLEMPAVALDWTHRLMRMMLKYRELV
jgi:arsenite-transporting ATPase